MASAHRGGARGICEGLPSQRDPGSLVCRLSVTPASARKGVALRDAAVAHARASSATAVQSRVSCRPSIILNHNDIAAIIVTTSHIAEAHAEAVMPRVRHRVGAWRGRRRCRLRHFTPIAVAAAFAAFFATRIPSVAAIEPLPPSAAVAWRFSCICRHLRLQRGASFIPVAGVTIQSLSIGAALRFAVDDEEVAAVEALAD